MVPFATSLSERTGIGGCVDDVEEEVRVAAAVDDDEAAADACEAGADWGAV